MVKVLFINPLVRQEDVPRHVPFGIAMLAAIAVRDGHKVQVYDHNAWRVGDDVLRQAMEADDWDVVAAGGITTAYGSLKQIFRMAAAHAPGALRVAGGGFLTSMPHDIMHFLPEIDVGVVGEAYLTFPELLAAMDAGARDFGAIAGLVVRDESGASRLTPPRGLLHELDGLPYPAYELFPLEEVYLPNSSIVMSEEAMTATRRLDINASYGCSLICRFCFHLGLSGDMDYVEGDDGKTDVTFDSPGHYTRTIRYHSARHIVDWVKHLVDRFDVNFVSFLDENLMTMDQFSRRTWMKEICELWIAEGLQPTCRRDGIPHDESCEGVHWGGTSHATLCTREGLKRMHAAGCSYLDYGWESFSPQILKTVGKGATPESNVRSYQWTMEAGIRPIPNQIIGFPNEDFESIRDSMRAWERLGIVTRPFFATPYPGSEWYALYKDRILEQYDGDLERFILSLGDATDITAVICENFDSVELYGLREHMIRGEFDKIARFEAAWCARNGDPKEGVRRALVKMKIKQAGDLVAAE